MLKKMKRTVKPDKKFLFFQRKIVQSFHFAVTYQIVKLAAILKQLYS